jgi:lipopolysaccharide export system permease protein
MKVSTRYLLYNFIPPFMLSCVFFVSFLLVFQLFRITRIVIQKGLPFIDLIELVSHIAVTFLPLAIPISCFFAALYTMNRMSEDSEIVAFRSFGLRKSNLLRPFLIAGVFIALGIFSLNQNLIPASKTIFKNTIIKLTSKGVLSDVQPGNFYTELPGIILFANEVSEDKKKLSGVFINVAKNGLTQSIYAKEGVLVKRKDNAFQMPSLRFFLTDGNIVKFNTNSNKTEKILFKDYDFPILDGNYTPGFVTKDSMRSNRVLLQAMEKKKKEIDKWEKKKDMNRAKGARKSLAKSEIEFFSRINTPFQCLLFIFLGFIFGIKKSRGKGKSMGSRALTVLILYYAVFFTGISMAKKGVMPTYLVIFIPTILATMLGMRQYQRLDWT